nr:flavodoxin family protein [Methanobacterium formicicum]
MVRIMGIVGSPRKEGNTENLIKEALKAAGDVGAEIELVRLGSAEIEPVWLVIYAKPLVNVPYTMIWEKYWKKMVKADGFIIGSPVYFGNVTSQLKMLMDRSRPLRMDFKLKNKVGGAIATGGSRNGGQETTIAAIHEFLLIQDAIVVGDGALWPTTVELVWEPLLRMRLDCKPHRIWVKEWLNWQ